MSIRIFHGGIDLAGLSDSPISSIAAGEVVFSGFRTKTGNTVIIYHPESGIHSLYGHGSKNLVKKANKWLLVRKFNFSEIQGSRRALTFTLNSYAGALVNPCALFKCRMWNLLDAQCAKTNPAQIIEKLSIQFLEITKSNSPKHVSSLVQQKFPHPLMKSHYHKAYV